MAEEKKKIEVVRFEIEDKKDDGETYGFSADTAVEKDGETSLVVLNNNEPNKKRGPGRPSKNSSANQYTDIVTVDNKKKEKSLDKQYEKGYIDNVKLLYTAIAQTDTIYSDINEELNKYRSNRSYGGRNRMMSMSNFMNTQTELINTKISAVKELNSIRSKINDLVMKKEQLLKDTGDDNSDKAVMDAYYALVNAPRYGLPTVHQALAPASINTGINLQGNVIPSTGIVTSTLDDQSDEQSFAAYQSNLDPVKQKMIADKDPNIKTVVVYDQHTGNKYFDVVNVQTGLSIPGIQRPADFLLNDMKIDTRNGVATNSNTNMVFPLVIVGTRVADEL